MDAHAPGERDFARWAALGRPRPDDVRLLITPRAAAPPPGTFTVLRQHAAITLLRRDGQAF